MVIDKADSIEEEDENADKESVYASAHQKKTFSHDDTVIEEECSASSESVEQKERKVSVVAIESKKAIEIEESHPKQQSRPIEASHLPPTTASTQTVPTEEFPEVPVASTTINQAGDVREIAQLNVETQQDTKIAHEIDSKETRKSFSFSNIEKDEARDAIADAAAKACCTSSKSCDDQLQKQIFLAHQQSISQDEDYEVAMVSGYLPGCVAPAPTPAPSIAPLAETEADPAEDDVDILTETCEIVEPKQEVERKKKRKEKKEKEGGEGQSTQADPDCSADPEKSKRNAVCPWEDE